MAADKKERVIHTRVSETLDDEIKRRATDLGLSVSNLVRNVLQHTFGLVEGIVHDSAEVARSARGATAPFKRGTRGPESSQSDDGPHVLGWHQAVLNVNAVCEVCNAVLPKGGPAAIGILDGPGPVPFRCAGCVQEGAEDDRRESHD